MRKLTQTGLAWLWVSVLIMLIDRLTKVAAQHFLVLHEPLPINAFFNLTLAYNKGAAFSFLGYASGWQVWLFGTLAVVVSASLLVWLARLSRRERWLAIALTCILGGALGNLWDRISYGHVVDFIQLHTTHWYWPVFNVADSAICVGAFMLAMEAVFSRKSKK